MWRKKHLYYCLSVFERPLHHPPLQLGLLYWKCWFFRLYLESNDPHMLMTFEKWRSRYNNTPETRMSLETKQPPLFSSCHPDTNAGDWLGDACLDIVPVDWTDAISRAAKCVFWSERSAPVSPGIVSQHNAAQTCWTPQTDPFVGFSSNAGWGTPMDRKWDFSPNTEGRASLGQGGWMGIPESNPQLKASTKDCLKQISEFPHFIHRMHYLF